jgi:hypothetical protein
MPVSQAPRLALLGALAGLSLLASGCGGSQAPSVASLGASTKSAGTNNPEAGSAFPIGSNMSMDIGVGGVKYSACMRAQGLTNYPDPDAKGEITITVSSSLDPRSPVFRRAQGACRHLIPAGEVPSPARMQRMKDAALAFAACMRTHGVPKYPDPTFSSGGVRQEMSPREVDPGSPAFRAAQKTCQIAHGPG